MTTQTEKPQTFKLVMGDLAPKLEVNTLKHGRWSLENQSPENYIMIVFYRGLHCPICIQTIHELEQKLDAFQSLGIQTIAISGDSLVPATQFQTQAKVNHLKIGYDLSLEDMRRWGLYISKGHFAQEPSLFNEPALFLIQPDGDLYFANIGNHPFSRINFDSLLNGLEYVIANNYPFRGTA